MLAGCQQPGGADETRVVSSKKIDPERPTADAGDRGRGDGIRDAPTVDLDALPPAPGNTYHVSARAEGRGDGSRVRPWGDLQAALCRLEPGDRLILLSGEYAGPYVIDAACGRGRFDAPIELYAVDDALLVAGEEAPVLTFRAEHWYFVGLEIAPGRVFSPAVHIAGGAHVTFERCHFHSGTGDGVLVGPGSADVVLRGCHIHQLGMHDEGPPRGRPENPDAAGVRIAPGTRDIAVDASEFHNIRGRPMVVIEPEAWAEATGESLPPAVNATFQGNAVRERQSRW